MTNTDRHEPEDRPMTAEEQAAAIEDNKLIRSLEDDDPRKYAHLLGRYDGNRRAGLRIDGVELHVLARLIRSAIADLEWAAEERLEQACWEQRADGGSE